MCSQINTLNIYNLEPTVDSCDGDLNPDENLNTGMEICSIVLIVHSFDDDV